MIARVTLEVSIRKEFDYAIPEGLAGHVEVGTRVKVPFGPRIVTGLVTALVEASPHTNLRSIDSIVGVPGVVTPRVLDLARWIASYYCCPVEVALKSVLPDSVRKENARWKERLHVSYLPPKGDLPKLSPRQRDVLHVVEEMRELPLQELLRLASTTPDTVRKLEDKGLLRIAPQVEDRDPYAHEEIIPTQPLALNAEQAEALEAIRAGLARAAPGGSGPPPKPFLLHGVTGSGKTEVYLQAIDDALGRGMGAIVLVPEISLTPQTVERFKARFGHGPRATSVAVLHSHLSSGERHDEWHKIRQGRARIVIGARSAVFAPVDKLGLVVVDEEHEHSYKQEEAPRYHARDVAVVRAAREGAVVVLGSATPSVESYWNARHGKYRLLEIKARATDHKLPVVRVVDLRLDSRRAEKGTPGVFSAALKEAIVQRLERREQTILFLNRRGYSTSLQCPHCGFVAGCPNCSVSLTFHRASMRLLCHVCGHAEAAPSACPKPECGHAGIRYAGLGTERVEETLSRVFPKARIARMDRDTLHRKDDYRRILGDFRSGRIDILVGTQMIAKGLHFPNVTLVGVLHADLSLHVPDFRSGERTFQLLTQVSGRAGRGDVEGEVFVQSFTPFHPAIQFSRRHDYQGFYEAEVETREALKYPPFSRIALLTLRGRNEDKVRLSAEYLRKELDRRVGAWPGIVIAGPAPAPLLKAESFFRHQLMVRCKAMSRLAVALAQLEAEATLPEDVRLVIDVDPVSLM
ncbi:MAG: primosomal protein N' [Verrucomicrobiota bacterium]|jgi:primosomal protein N' (replication factor Y)